MKDVWGHATAESGWNHLQARISAVFAAGHFMSGRDSQHAEQQPWIRASMVLVGKGKSSVLHHAPTRGHEAAPVCVRM